MNELQEVNAFLWTPIIVRKPVCLAGKTARMRTPYFVGEPQCKIAGLRQNGARFVTTEKR